MDASSARGTLDDILGFELTEFEDDRADGRVVVSDRLKQPHGLVHGGVYATLAESLASAATHRVVADDGLAVPGLRDPLLEAMAVAAADRAPQADAAEQAVRRPWRTRRAGLRQATAAQPRTRGKRRRGASADASRARHRRRR